MKKVNVGDFRNFGIVQKRYELHYESQISPPTDVPEYFDKPDYVEDFYSLTNSYFYLKKISTFERSMQQSLNISSDYTAIGYYDNRITNGDRIIFFPEDIVHGRRAISDSVFRVDSIVALETGNRQPSKYMELKLTSGVFTTKATVYPKSSVRLIQSVIVPNLSADTTAFNNQVQAGEILPTMSSSHYENGIYNPRLVVVSSNDFRGERYNNYMIIPIPHNNVAIGNVYILSYVPTGMGNNIDTLWYSILFSDNDAQFIGNRTSQGITNSYTDVKGYDINVFLLNYRTRVTPSEEQVLAVHCLT